MDGDARRFARTDGVQQAWRAVEPVLVDPPPVVEYEPGSWGPSRAHDLVGPEREWHAPEEA